MPKRETPMTHRYWKQVGGTLLEEYCIVRPGPDISPRWIDGVIIVGGDHRIAPRREHSSIGLDGRDLIVVQTKASRLGMPLLGQALFSRELVKEHFAPRSVDTVALCGADDAILRPLAERHEIKVVVDGLSSLSTFSPKGARLRREMTQRYGQQMGGTLLEKYCVVPASRGIHGRQVIDAVIITDNASRGEHGSLSLDGNDLIVVNASVSPLGMGLLGRALLSRELVTERFAPRYVRTVALCAAGDAVLRPIAERFRIEVVVDPL